MRLPNGPSVRGDVREEFACILAVSVKRREDGGRSLDERAAHEGFSCVVYHFRNGLCEASLSVRITRKLTFCSSVTVPCVPKPPIKFPELYVSHMQDLREAASML